MASILQEPSDRQIADLTAINLQRVPMSTSPSPSITGRASLKSSAFWKGTELTGRILLAALFLLSGLGKIGSYSATTAYMSSVGLPSALLPLVIATEIGGAIAIIVGWKTRITSFLLAGFTALTALTFHSNFADQIQMVMFLKNVSIAGAFLLLVVHGAGPLSIDQRLAR
jgi:putative oxidoreductase